jgi:hypothetical protein
MASARAASPRSRAQTRGRVTYIPRRIPASHIVTPVAGIGSAASASSASSFVGTGERRRRRRSRDDDDDDDDATAADALGACDSRSGGASGKSGWLTT